MGARVVGTVPTVCLAPGSWRVRYFSSFVGVFDSVSPWPLERGRCSAVTAGTGSKPARQQRAFCVVRRDYNQGWHPSTVLLTVHPHSVHTPRSKQRGVERGTFRFAHGSAAGWSRRRRDAPELPAPQTCLEWQSAENQNVCECKERGGGSPGRAAPQQQCSRCCSNCSPPQGVGEPGTP